MRNTYDASSLLQEDTELRDLTIALEQLRLAQQRVDNVRQ